MPLFTEMSKPLQWATELINDTTESWQEAVLEHFFKLRQKPTCAETLAFHNNILNHKSRSSDVPCLDETRVKVSPDQSGNDFMHANYVKLPNMKCNLILAQAPVLETATEFWEMIWQEKITLILCLTKLVEGGKKRTYEYWPTSTGNKNQHRYGTLGVRNIGVKNAKNLALTVLQSMNQKTKEKRTMHHYFYMDWNEHQLPNCIQDFFSLIDYLDSEVMNIKNTPMPTVLIHSTAGIGRTGTIAALMSLCGTVSAGERPNVCQTVSLVRKQRAMAVQETEQYIFLHFALASYIVQNSTLSLEWKAEAMAKLRAFNQHKLRDSKTIEAKL